MIALGGAEVEYGEIDGRHHTDIFAQDSCKLVGSLLTRARFNLNFRDFKFFLLLRMP